jgi:hypothetical protein
MQRVVAGGWTYIKVKGVWTYLWFFQVLGGVGAAFISIGYSA